MRINLIDKKNNIEFGYSFELKYTAPQVIWKKIEHLIKDEIEADKK